MAVEILTTFQLKRGTANRWVEVNPILKQGEPGFEYDTGKLKIGDGIHTWLELDYIGETELSPDENEVFELYGGSATDNIKLEGEANE